MYGKSWGGFNSLQVAAHRPPALRAVISAYFTDDRYADDVHHMGGCLLSHEALSWSSHMLTMNALPPDPHHAGAGWRETWLARLEQQPGFVDACERVVLISACSGHGAKFAPLLGELVVDLALGTGWVPDAFRLDKLRRPRVR